MVQRLSQKHRAFANGSQIRLKACNLQQCFARLKGRAGQMIRQRLSCGRGNAIWERNHAAPSKSKKLCWEMAASVRDCQVHNSFGLEIYHRRGQYMGCTVVSPASEQPEPLTECALTAIFLLRYCVLACFLQPKSDDLVASPPSLRGYILLQGVLL